MAYRSNSQNLITKKLEFVFLTKIHYSGFLKLLCKIPLFINVHHQCSWHLSEKQDILTSDFEVGTWCQAVMCATDGEVFFFHVSFFCFHIMENPDMTHSYSRTWCGGVIFIWSNPYYRHPIQPPKKPFLKWFLLEVISSNVSIAQYPHETDTPTFLWES